MSRVDKRCVTASAGFGPKVVLVRVEGSNDLELNPETDCRFREKRVCAFRERRDRNDVPARGALRIDQSDALSTDEGGCFGIELAVTDDSESTHEETVRRRLDGADPSAPNTGATHA